MLKTKIIEYLLFNINIPIELNKYILKYVNLSKHQISLEDTKEIINKLRTQFPNNKQRSPYQSFFPLVYSKNDKKDEDNLHRIISNGGCDYEEGYGLHKLYIIQINYIEKSDEIRLYKNTTEFIDHLEYIKKYNDYSDMDDIENVENIYFPEIQLIFELEFNNCNKPEISIYGHIDEGCDYIITIFYYNDEYNIWYNYDNDLEDFPIDLYYAENFKEIFDDRVTNGKTINILSFSDYFK